jgi:hypothetical protein
MTTETEQLWTATDAMAHAIELIDRGQVAEARRVLVRTIEIALPIKKTPVRGCPKAE